MFFSIKIFVNVFCSFFFYFYCKNDSGCVCDNVVFCKYIFNVCYKIFIYFDRVIGVQFKIGYSFFDKWVWILVNCNNEVVCFEYKV